MEMNEGKRKKLGRGKMSKVQIVSVFSPSTPLTQGKFTYTSAMSTTELGKILGSEGKNTKTKTMTKTKTKRRRSNTHLDYLNAL